MCVCVSVSSRNGEHLRRGVVLHLRLWVGVGG